jgi:ElaB/YqjD/DUF883 family membrane-anchored ribosome-binding protein
MFQKKFFTILLSFCIFTCCLLLTSTVPTPKDAKYSLLHLKEVAQEKFYKAWDALINTKDQISDAIKNAFETAERDYQSAKEKWFQHFDHSVSETGKEYEASKKNLQRVIAEFKVFLNENTGKDLDEKAQLQREDLHKQLFEAKERYDAARIAFTILYDDSVRDASTDFRHSKKRFDSSQAVAKPFSQRALEASRNSLSKILDAFKNLLSNSKEVAKENYETAKQSFQSLESAAQHAGSDAVQAEAEQTSHSVDVAVQKASKWKLPAKLRKLLHNAADYLLAAEKDYYDAELKHTSHDLSLRRFNWFGDDLSEDDQSDLEKLYIL